MVADSLNELQRLMDRKMDRFLAQEMHAVSLTAARTSLREIVPLQMLRRDGTVGQYADPSREAEGGTEERDECRSCVFPIAALLLTPTTAAIVLTYILRVAVAMAMQGARRPKSWPRKRKGEKIKNE